MFLFGTLIFSVTGSFSQVAVTTYHNDNARTGQNSQEQILTPANVNASTFGKLFSYNLQPQPGYHASVYAQPLLLPNVSVNGSLRNLVYVVTERNQVFAFDADGKQSTPIWERTLETPAVANAAQGYLAATIGIQSTPVIDPASGTLYLVECTTDSAGNNMQKLRALDVATGADKFGSPVVIQASVPGTGDGGSTVTFNPVEQNQRPALLLSNGLIYIAWGSYGDDTTFGSYHGWVMAYDAQTLQQKAVFNSTPSGNAGSTWALGALAADPNGMLYVGTANGTSSAQLGGADYGDSYLKLNGSTLSVVDWFMPYDWANLNSEDQDLNGGGAIVLPDQAGAFPHLLIWGSKAGKIYLLNRDNMGQFNSAGDSQIVQSLQAWSPASCDSDDNSCVRTLPAYWNGNIYFIPQNHGLEAYSLSNGQLSTTPTSAETTVPYTLRGASPSISANGTSNGIVWAVKVDPASTSGSGQPATLYAYDATNVSQLLYTSNDNAARDALGASDLFDVPTIANGKVYVATRDTLSVYGLLSSTSPQPPTAVLTITPASGVTPLTVMASTSGSSDPNSGGSITSSSINFGDGTIVNASMAEHTYTLEGSYTVTGTVTDNAGLFSSATQTVTVSDEPPVACSGAAGNPSVGVCSPANGSTVQSPVHVVAAVTSSVPVTTMQIYDNNKLVYQVKHDSIDTYLAATVGSHHLVIKAWETTGGNFYSSLQITVTSSTNPAPTIQFSANPTSISSGQSSTLSWSTTDATSVNIQPGIGTVGTSGSVTVSPASTTTYTATATGADGSANSAATVTVQSSGGCTLSAVGPSVTVCSPANGSTVPSPVHLVAGVTSGTPVTTMQVYDNNKLVYQVKQNSIDTYLTTAVGSHWIVMKAWESNGSSFYTPVQVTVSSSNNPAPTIQFSANPTSISAGQSATLLWSTSNATSVNIQPEVGAVGPSGSVTVFPTATTTYTATATGAGGTSNSAATVTVRSGSACTLSTVDPSVTVCSPANGSTVTSPAHIIAKTTSSSAVTDMQIYDNNNLVYEVRASSIDTMLTMSIGSHHLVVKGWRSGVSFLTSLQISVTATQ